ncbi:MAG: YcxB family protein [Mycobacterium leprae]
MFVVEDDLHAEPYGQYPTFAAALEAVHRLAAIPWNEGPNRAPCTAGQTCGRSWGIQEYDQRQTSGRKGGVPLTIEYELTHDDIMAFNLFHLAHSPAARRSYRRTLLTFPTAWLVICLLILFGATRHGRTWWQGFVDLLPLFSVVPAYPLLFTWLYRRSVRKRMRAVLQKDQDRTCPTRCGVTISGAGIEVGGSDGQTHLSWSDVEHIASTESHALLYISASQAIIVPRRTFSSEQEFVRFIETAGQYRRSARS